MYLWNVSKHLQDNTVPENHNPHFYYRENLKSHIISHMTVSPCLLFHKAALSLCGIMTET
jgi:hypothetical protein